MPKPPADATAGVTETRHVADLRLDPANARKRTERNLGMIRDSLKEDGAGRSILIDEANQVIAGNGTLLAATDVGMTKVQIVEAEGDALIAVRRRNLTPEQKQRLALRDNRAAELAEWDADVLRQMAPTGVLDGMFTGKELAALIPPEAQVAVEELEEIAVERPADVVWILMALPLAEWPTYQATVEAMQSRARFSQAVVRPKEGVVK